MRSHVRSMKKVYICVCSCNLLVIHLDATWIQVVIGLTGLVISGILGLLFYQMWSKQKDLFDKFTPIVSNVMKNMRAGRIESKEVKDIEGKISQNIMENIGSIFPEIEIARSFGIIDDELLEMLTSNPQAIPILLQRYGGVIQMITKKGQGQGQKQTKFDY